MYRTDVEFEVKFEVKNINFRNDEDRFKILTAKILDHTYPGTLLSSEMAIQGIIPSAMPGDTFKGIGVFAIHQVHGPSIKLKGYPVATLPQVKKGIAEFIKKRVRGLGVKTSQKIVETLGLDAISMIEKDYKCLLNVQGISEKRAKIIHEKIGEHRKFEDVAMFVQANGMEYPIAMKIYDEFKNDSIIKLKENPYSIAVIPKLDFTHADRFAYNLGFQYDNYERIKSAVVYYVNYQMKNYGDLCVFKEELVKRFNEFLLKFGAYPEEESTEIDISIINNAIKELIECNFIVTEQNSMGATCIYRKDYNVIENQIISNIKKLLSDQKQPFCIKEQIDNFLVSYETNNLKLADQQRNAVYMAIQNGISILTGGPGTGKTQTTNTIVKCIYNIKPHATIMLLAPTGKASRRMTELTSMEASTIHRGIGLNGFSDGGELAEINCDYVFIDESSMVDAYVFNALISNIGENTRIIFVGDHEQLPSVGPGLILRDLINSNRIPVTKLDKIFRQAENSQIIMNAHAIIKGNKSALKFDNTKKDFYFLRTTEKLRVKEKILKSIENMINNQGYKLSDICILSPMRKGEIGVNELNRVIQMKFNPSSDKPEYYIDTLSCFRVGDRVMQTQNNYDIRVMNGDVGEISSIYTNSGEYIIEVQYPDKETPVQYTEKIVDELELAFAMTIHKSQGSEFPVVIMPVHREFNRMLSKNLIYTGVTRAKSVVVMIGTEESLHYAMERKDGIKRNSRIKEKIQNEISLKIA